MAILLGTTATGETLPVLVDQFGNLLAKGIDGDPMRQPGADPGPRRRLTGPRRRSWTKDGDPTAKTETNGQDGDRRAKPWCMTGKVSLFLMEKMAHI